MKRLSVALAVFNEEKTLRRCLDSVKDIADEIVVVDGGSTDKTLAIAKEYGATVIETDNPQIFHINKQKALDACTGEWILQLDADEELSPALTEEVSQVIDKHESKEHDEHMKDQKKRELFLKHQQMVEERDGIKRPTEGPINAYYVPRRNFFLGKGMTYAGMYPDGVIRLLRRGKVQFPSKSVHEQIEVEGRVDWLSSDLFHYSDPTFKRYFLRMDTYTNLVAKDIKKEKRNAVFIFIDYCLLKLWKTFFTLFIRHKGFLDGVHGFLFSFFSALHYPVAYWKYVFQAS